MIGIAEIEQCQPQPLIQSGSTWNTAGAALTDTAKTSRAIGLNRGGAWEGAAADAADHQMDSVLNAASSSGWSIEGIGFAAKAYGYAAQVAQGVIKGLKSTLGLVMPVDNMGNFYPLIPHLAGAAKLATTIARTTLAMVTAVETATATAIEALTVLPHEVAARPAPLDVPVMPASTIELPVGSATIVGDLAGADRIITLVGGVGSGSEDAMAKQEAFAHQIVNTDAANIAVVSWNGYQPPPNIALAMLPDYARSGAEHLREFQDQLREANPGASLHVSGYSYGSVVVGEAATTGQLDADRVTFLGSPGVRAGHASELRLNPGATVEAFNAPGDAVAAGSFAASAVGPGIHGTDPASPEFGAVDLLGGDTDRENPPDSWGQGFANYATQGANHLRLLKESEFDAHSSYYVDPTIVEAFQRER